MVSGQTRLVRRPLMRVLCVSLREIALLVGKSDAGAADGDFQVMPLAVGCVCIERKGIGPALVGSCQCETAAQIVTILHDAASGDFGE